MNYAKRLVIFFAAWWLSPPCFSIIDKLINKVDRPTLVFAHGLSDSPISFGHSLQTSLTLDCYLHSSTGAEFIDGYFDTQRICFGQDTDVNQLTKACGEVVADKEADIIAFGFSKGAATWINTLGFLSESSLEKHQKIIASIKAVVLIAPFADLFEVEGLSGLFGSFSPIAKRFAFNDTLGWGRRAVGKILRSFFPAYNPHGMHPITSIKKIKQNIPIFIAHSFQDEVIPIKHSRMIYAALRKQGNNDVYLFEFSGGKHSRSMHACSEWHKPMYDFLAYYGVHKFDDLSGESRSDKDTFISLIKYSPSIGMTEKKISQDSITPSLAYGLVFAVGKELVSYAINKSAYKSSWKKSCLYGLGVAALLELTNVSWRT